MPIVTKADLGKFGGPRHRVTLAAGTATVALPQVTEYSQVMLTIRTVGGTAGSLQATINPGVGFTINSTSNTDASVVNYRVV